MLDASSRKRLADACTHAAWPGAVLVALAVVAAYANSLGAAFVFDDTPGIVLNRTIRDLGNLAAVFSPPPDAAGAGARPLVNFTLALNYALGGLHPWGYHAFNVLVHLATALVLFGLLRRTLARPALAKWVGGAAKPLALAATLVWAVHPLLTESVTFVIQRNESLAGFFLLLTLYGFVRAVDAASPRAGRWWMSVMVGACLLGVFSKELMATAPLAVLLYDRTFVSSGFRAAWRRHGGWYLALFATWIPLGWLVISAGQRGGTVGFGLGMSSWHYLLTQCGALVRYLHLALWPDELVLDYGSAVAAGPGDVWLEGTVVLALLAATGWALVHRPVAGFIGAWFFLILGPSSSFVPLTTQTIAEHRMYLPLLALVVPGVVLLHRLLGRRAAYPLASLVLVLGWLTVQRNFDYRSEIAILRDSVAKRPDNYRAHYDLGTALAAANQPLAAIEEYRAALRLEPEKADAHNNLAQALLRVGRTAEAVAEYEATIRLDPRPYDAHTNLGNVLHGLGRTAEALEHYDAALQLKPDLTAALIGRGNALSDLGRAAEAVQAYRAALRLEPDDYHAHYNLGNMYLEAGRVHEAITEYTEALRLKPDLAPARNNLGIARRRAGLEP